jgi:hypothetical protein
MAETTRPISEVSIANMAATLIGERRLLSFDDPSKFGQMMSAEFGYLRDEALQMHPWSFAQGRAVLVEDTDPPAFGWLYSYECPADHLTTRRLRYEGQHGGLNVPFEKEGTKLLTNMSAPLLLIYVKRVTAVSKFTPLFSRLLAAHIAVTAASSITGKNSYMANAADAFQRATYAATLHNALDSGTTESYVQETADSVRGRGLN